MEVADDAQLANMHKVVANGQMEFINGGWCMHDEVSGEGGGVATVPRLSTRF